MSSNKNNSAQEGLKNKSLRSVFERYTYSEDIAIVKYICDNNRYLYSSGIQVWKDAEKLQICPGRSYLSMKERFRKVIVKNFKQYNVDKALAMKITQFLRASKDGKDSIRYKLMSHT